MARLCLPTTGVELLNVSGVIKFTGTSKSFTDEADSFFKFLKPSQVVLTDGNLLPCLQRLEVNKSDFAFGNYPLGGGPYFHVPVVKDAFAPALLSGYEVNKYIEDQTNKPFLKYGLLENYKAFDGATYVLIILLFTTFFFVKFMFNLLFRKVINGLRHRKLCKRANLRVQRGSHLRTLSLVGNVCFFFISVPFFLTYKTSQVVVEKPFVPIDYETVMKHNITILSRLTVLKDEYLKPSARNVKNNDLTFRFYTYYKRRKLERKDYESKDHKNDLINFIFRNYRLAKNLVEKKFVVFTHLDTALYLRRRLCTTSSENEYFRLFVAKDASQKEVNVGIAVRNGFVDPELKKKLTRWTETMPSRSRIDPTGFTVEWLGKNVLMRRKRRGQQLLYCLDEKLKAYQKEEIFASDLRFFLAFTLVILSLYVVAFCVLLVECLYFCYKFEICNFFRHKLGITRNTLHLLQRGTE